MKTLEMGRKNVWCGLRLKVKSKVFCEKKDFIRAFKKVYNVENEHSLPF